MSAALAEQGQLLLCRSLRDLQSKEWSIRRCDSTEALSSADWSGSVCSRLIVLVLVLVLDVDFAQPFRRASE